MRAQCFRTGLAAGVALLATTQWAAALDADDFAKKFAAAYAAQGAEITYDSASGQGDTVTIKNVKMEMPGEEEGLNFGDLDFDGVSEDGSGGYNAASLSKDKIEFSAEDVRFSVSDLEVENLYVPAETGGNTLDDLLFYDSVTTGPIVLNVEGNDVFQASRSVTKTSNNSDNTRVGFDSRIDGLDIDLGAVEDAQARQAIDGMGYQTITGDIVINGYWALPTGEITLSEYALTLDDVGRLDLQFSISGYTLDFIKGLQQMQEQMASQSDDAKAQQAMGLAMMGMMQQLTFNSMSIRFDDASLTNKILDMVASQQGMSRDQMVQGLQGMLPLVLAQLQNPEFQKQVTEAVSLYLSDPKSIEISAKPEAPLPFASIAGSAMGAPLTLPQVMNVSVTANQN